MASDSKSDGIQVLTYIRRNPALTREQFYEHWEKVHGPKVIPWIEKHGLKRYQQIHVSGGIVPSAATSSAPNASSQQELPKEPVEFDGIAMFTTPALKQWTKAFEDPYFLDVIRPDEVTMIDTKGIGGGIVASFNGKVLDMVIDGKNASGAAGDKYRKAYEEYRKSEAI
ncbi:EthD domain-containing protein [Lophiotrema nucula]|uniref:EthD domain-containing protein n=1 Tax=Lophiotrema nucula TaxID=690887 RepID=A0A6A5YIE0_9PLEO|nr:EthD domain-containing protein [Lophiotrema nucula]